MQNVETQGHHGWDTGKKRVTQGDHKDCKDDPGKNLYWLGGEAQEQQENHQTNYAEKNGTAHHVYNGDGLIMVRSNAEPWINNFKGKKGKKQDGINDNGQANGFGGSN